MTSNGEKEFPPAFRRRCLPLRLQQPSPEKLREIVEQHLGIVIEGQEPETDAGKLISEFLNARDVKNQSLATDQLLNALYLLDLGHPLQDREDLRKALFAALSAS